MNSQHQFPLGKLIPQDSSSLLGYTCKSQTVSAGVTEYHFSFHLDSSRPPQPVTIEWKFPILDIVAKWHPLIGTDRSLTSGWCTYIQTYATRGAPVYSLFSEFGENRQTFALSDAINPVSTRIQVEEDSADIKCEVVLFDAPSEPIADYSIVLRIDQTDRPYHQSIGAISNWWASMPEYRPAPVPPSAYDPVYSTWYSFHQELTEDSIEAECNWAKQLGCDTVIVDDGWQTEDSNKGYQYCGDWEIAPSKFPSFSEHVERIHNLDIRYLLWFSVPYLGRKSKAWKDYEDRILPKHHANAGCLDPRFPGVRQYLIDLYKKAIIEWGLDGLKLDFVDQFTAEVLAKSEVEEHDMISVPAAADRLLSEMHVALHQARPDILIEFRQKYIGPAMRKYGNILRAQDCPNDALSNRVRTIDVRLLAGNTAVHSDMIMWHPEESVERVSQQLWASLFAVPQISVREKRIQPKHERALRFFLEFWTAHRDCLVMSELDPQEPHLLYPVVTACNQQERIIAVYQADKVITLPRLDRPTYLINASPATSLYFKADSLSGECKATVLDCTGDQVHEQSLSLDSPVASIPVPPSGVLKLALTD